MNWYLDEKDRSIFSPLQIMFTAHFGSVVGASFMTAFFSIGDFIFDCMRPDPSLCPQYYTNCFNAGFSWLEEIFSLVRSDSLTFVQMAGKPYCNSARYCEYLNDKTIIARSSQSTSRSYRFCAHLLIAGILAIVSLYINGIGTSFYVMLFVIVQTVFISTLFISLHADAAEALQLILLN